MNIRKLLLLKDKNDKYASSFRRAMAVMIDIWITVFIRAVFAQVAGILVLNRVLYDFLNEFKNEFGTSTPKNTPEHIDFIIHHKFFYYMLIFYAILIMIGAVYHAYLNSSSWRGTIGKRLMKIMITTANELPITFNRGLLHYFLSALPFLYVFYLFVYQVRHEVTFYQAITASDLNILLGIVFVFWVQINLFTKRKTTAYDLIANTVVIEGRTYAKWPWTK